MTTLHPAYELRVEDRRISTIDEPRASTVVDLDVALDMDTPADSLTVRLGNVGGLAPRVGDRVELDLGYEDEGVERVFTGAVAAVQPGVALTRMVALGMTAPLLRDRRDSTHLATRASAVVRAVASDLGLDVDVDSSDPALPYVLMTSRSSVYDQLRGLADLLGRDLYADRDGRIVFRPFAGTVVAHVLVWGEHIVDLAVRRRPRSHGAVRVFGESAGGTGQGRQFWLTKDFTPRRGEAGTGAPALLQQRAVVRDRATATLAAQATDVRLEEATLTGEVLVQGRPAVHLGDAVTLQGVPDDDLATTHQVRRVRHRLTKRAGFTTVVGFSGLPGGGGPS